LNNGKEYKYYKIINSPDYNICKNEQPTFKNVGIILENTYSIHPPFENRGARHIIADYIRVNRN